MQIKEIYDKMDYGAAPESSLEAHNWLEKHNYNFGNFINGESTQILAMECQRFQKILQRVFQKIFEK